MSFHSTDSFYVLPQNRNLAQVLIICSSYNRYFIFWSQLYSVFTVTAVPFHRVAEDASQDPGVRERLDSEAFSRSVEPSRPAAVVQR